MAEARQDNMAHVSFYEGQTIGGRYTVCSATPIGVGASARRVLPATNPMLSMPCALLFLRLHPITAQPDDGARAAYSRPWIREQKTRSRSK